MRLKRLLGHLTLLIALSAILAASTAQLTEVGVQASGSTTTLTIRASGAFTHTEYRPADNLLLIDLAGVSASKLENRTRELAAHPGVQSYRVLGYKGANGANTTRIEVTLVPNAQVNVSESGNALQVRVSGETLTAKAAAPAPAPHKSDAAAAPVAAHPVQIRNVTVSRGKAGMQVEIAASGPMAPKAMKLTAPDRIVIDVPNATPAMAKKLIPVNSGEIKAVRMAKYSQQPPSTRIVVDLARMQEFALESNGPRATLKLGSTVAAQPAETKAAPATITAMVVPAQAPTTASNSVLVLEPKVTTRPATKEDVAPVEPTPAQRAVEAASKFQSSATDIPLTNTNASMKTQPPLTPAVMQSAAAQATSASSGGCAGNKFTGEPISVNLKDVDVKDFFRLIHEISGLNIVLDQQVKGNLTIVLEDVPWDQALSIVMKNNSLDCQLDGNVLRIAATATLKKEADDRRAQIDAQALAVDTVTINRYLSYAVAKDAVPTIKGFLSARGTVLADDRTNALIISDIPNTLPAIDRLIRELDRKTQEVEIEARVVAATRSFARDIGTQLAFGIANDGGSTAVGGASAVGTSPISRTPVPGIIHVGDASSGNPLPIPFFSNLGVGARTSSGLSISNVGSRYRLDFILTMAETRGLVKILSRPRIVTQNNVQAVVRQGQRIPVVTAAQLGGPPTVTYVDAFLRLTVRPQITAEGTIFLNVDVENT
ncbi:MAG: AMIN domain-containing protein, partial [Acidobacteriales bacterium]|nr:AMIN domain-containing protein [Terriglobales bacterium]